MTRSLLAEDPEAIVAPYLMSGGTDAKGWSTLGVRCFGFAPLQLPPDLDFVAMFHGVDERVPVDSLIFGAEVNGVLRAGKNDEDGEDVEDARADASSTAR